MNGTDSIFKDLGWKLLPWIANIVCGFLAWWASTMNNEIKSVHLEIQSLKEWRAETSGSRYTSKDHALYAEAQAAELARLWKAQNELQSQWIREVSAIRESIAALPKDNPPKWFETYVREGLSTHEQRISALEKKP